MNYNIDAISNSVLNDDDIIKSGVNILDETEIAEDPRSSLKNYFITKKIK
jgi:hypothetical protein